MKNYLIIVILVVSFCAYSEFKIEKIVKLTDDKNIYEAPKWSPDGKYIAVITNDYKGLFLINPNTLEKTKISNDEITHQAFVWSEDSKNIAYRANTKEEMHIKVIDIESKEIKTAITSTDWISFPFWQYSEKGKRAACINDEGKLLSSKYGVFKDEKHKSIYKRHNFDKNIVYAGGWKKNSKNQDIVINNDGKISKGINLKKLSATFSPNRRYYSYTYNGDIFVFDENGQNEINLGRGMMLSWSPNSNRLVYCIAVEDEISYSESDLYIIDIDGKNKMKLTKTEDEIEMFPDWSPEGDKIVYTSLKTGNLYLIYLCEK